MTANTIKKYRTVHYNAKGRPEAVTLNLKNRALKKFYEVLMEDFMDTIAVKEAMKQDDGTRYQMIFEGDDYRLVEIKE